MKTMNLESHGTLPTTTDPAAAEFDALADLFLDGPAPTTLRFAPAADERNVPETPPRGIGPGAEIEGLILGHLPTYAGAWITQYAKSVAEEESRPVALLRLRGGEAVLDLVMPAGEPKPRLGAVASLEAGVAAAAALTDRWMLHTDGTAEADLASTPSLHRLTLLTGADETALVASYQTIKNVVSAGPTDERRVRVAIMGADEAKAAAAQDRISRTVSLHLSADVEFSPRVGKVGTTSAVPVLRAKAMVSPAEVVAWIKGARRTTDAPRQASPESVTPPPRAAEPTAGATEAAHRPGSAAVEPGVLLSAMGLRLLATICPIAPGVRLAAGGDGSLHLVAFTDTPGVTRDLLGAAAWADQHAELLAAAHAGVLRVSEAWGPTLHVVTREAKSCRALLDTGVRVHLAVGVGGAWAVRGLN